RPGCVERGVGLGGGAVWVAGGAASCSAVLVAFAELESVVLSVSGTVAVEQDVAPEVTITAPTQTQKLRSDQPVSFSGTALDSFDGDRSSVMTWSSNRDGNLGTGGSFSKTLSLGSHTITARATDTGGLAGT